MTLGERYERGASFEDYIAQAEKNRDLWRALAERARVPEEIAARARALPGHRHLLVLAEDWCGDAVNTVPVIARLASITPNLDLRILARDRNPDLMDTHLTNGTRSIPVVMVLDERWAECGWWGPRPAPLQRWVLETGLAMPKDARYREVRRWYARDQGRTTLQEVVGLLEGCAGRTGSITDAA